MRTATLGAALLLLLHGCAAAPAARRIVSTPAAPAAIGPYSQAVLVGGTLFVAGQIALVPASGALVEGGITAQTQQVMRNVEAILSAAGFSLADVAQAQVFLADLDDFAEFNAAYGAFFSGAPPARAVVQAARIPRDALVEIMVTAVR